MRRFVVALVLLILVFLVVSIVEQRSVQDQERIANDVTSEPPQTVPPGDLIDYANYFTPLARFRTYRDALPGGWSAAMLPVFVDWELSDLDGPEPFYILRNVNSGGNPVDGTVILCTVRIPARAIETVEYQIVPMDPLGTRGVVAHAQLRFIFSPEHQGEYLNPSGGAPTGYAALPDLVLSWEAWRGPGVDWDPLTGMDPAVYGLTLRAYSGAQRFLEDALNKRDWHSHFLRLPGGQEGFAELLRVCLTIGDASARYNADQLLQKAEHEWLRSAPDDADDDGTVARYHELMASLRASSPEHSDVEVPAEQLTYQSLLRSCSTMALYTVNLTVERLNEAGHAGARPATETDIFDMPPWMEEMATASIGDLFMRAPTALRFVKANKEFIPTRVPGLLDQAGLLERRDGKMLVQHYSIGGTGPYGEMSQFLVR